MTTEGFTALKAFMASTLAVLAWLLGGFDSLLQGLCLLMALDIITGVLKAISLKTLSSDVSFKGMTKKVYIFVLVAVAVIVDGIAGTDTLIRTGVIFFYSITESLSIIENASILGVPIPGVLKDALAKLQEKTQ